MFEHNHYVPTFKLKKGEANALRDLSNADKTAITPLIETPPVPWDFSEDQPAKPLDVHLSKMPKLLASSWGMTTPVFLDLNLADGLVGARHPVDWFHEQVAAESVSAIPVTSPTRDAAYQAAVKMVTSRDSNGVCIRLDLSDSFDPGLAASVAGLLSQLGVLPGNCDLIFDFGSVSTAQVNLLRAAAAGALATFPNLVSFRTVTLLAGAFPVNLSSFAAGAVHSVPRCDLHIWQGVIGAALPRRPAFGDYTASNPVQPEIDPRIMSASASIRYCSTDDWLIFRGRSVRTKGYSQYQDLSSQVVVHPAYGGPTYCWADAFIEQCAGGGPSGNLTTWRQVATNRHLAFVSRQIASVP